MPCDNQYHASYHAMNVFKQNNQVLTTSLVMAVQSRMNQSKFHDALWFSRSTIWMCVIVTFLTVCMGVTSAGIPEPPSILYGQLVIDSQMVQATDSVNIIARVSGVPNPIGTYIMGQNAAAGNNYVIMLRLESTFGSLPLSDNASQAGQTVDLFITVADGPERPAGQIQNLGSNPSILNNLNVITTFGQCADEAAGIGLEDAAKFIKCMTGEGGSISLECGCGDFDKDGDSDMADWAKMQIAFTGAT